MKRFLALTALLITLPACSAAWPGAKLARLQITPVRPNAAPQQSTVTTQISGVASVPASASGLRVLALTETPVADAAVFLLDGQGKPVAGVASTRTDAQGRFTLAGMPVGKRCVVNVVAEVGGKTVSLSTVVTASAGGTAANVGIVSTMATRVVLESDEPDVTKISMKAYNEMVTAIAAALEDGELPDLADPQALVAKVDAIAAQNDTLKAAIAALVPPAEKPSHIVTTP